MLTQRSEVVNTRSSLAKSSSDLAEGARAQQQGETEGWCLLLAANGHFHMH